MAIIKVGDKATAPSVRPSLLLDFANSKSLDPRITFTRSATGTYWDGKSVTRGEENHVLNGVTINYNRGSVSSNQENPYGNSDATCYLYTEDTNAGSHDIYHVKTTGYGYATTGQDLTASVYVRPSGKRYVSFSFANSANHFVYIVADLVDGTITETGAVGTGSYSSSSIEAIGENGWYRLTLTGEITSYQTQFIFVAGASSGTPGITGDYGRDPHVGDGASGFYVWGYQIEHRNFATDYTQTTDKAVVKYQPTLQSAPANVARFEHDPDTGESLGLLMEKTKTNLQIDSENAGNVNALYRLSVRGNVIVAPDGTNTGDKLVEQAINSSEYYARYTCSGGNYSGYATVSVYVHEKSERDLFIRPVHASCPAPTSALEFRPATQTLTSISGYFESDKCGYQYVGGGWYRVWGTLNLPVSGPLQLGIQPIAGSTGYVGDGVSGLYIWGRQMEQGETMTSYISTAGTTSATRSEDNAIIEGSIWDAINPKKDFSFYVDAKYIPDSKWPENARFSTEFYNTIGSTSYRFITYNASGGNTLFMETHNVQESFLGDTSTKTGSTRIAVRIQDDNVAASVDGQTTEVDTDVEVPITNAFSIGNRSGGPNATIAKIAIYDDLLSNDELQALTEE